MDMIQFYKPNPKVTGTACSFWVSKDGSIMTSMIKQDSWNDVKKKGSFLKNKDNPQKKVVSKLSRIEVAGIIDSIERNAEFKTFHSSQNQVLQIRFASYLDKETQIQKGFSFSINKQNKEDSTQRTGFIIGLSYPEARLLKHDLEKFLSSSPPIQSSLEEPPQSNFTTAPKQIQSKDEGQEADSDSW